MPLSYQKPNHQDILELIRRSCDAEFSYSETSATRFARNSLDLKLANGFSVDHNRILLGRGQAAFQRAKVALTKWEMFNLRWVEAIFAQKRSSKSSSIKVGTTMAVLARGILWSVNPCRIVYTIEDETFSRNSDSETSNQDQIIRFGFGYGTLPGHVERGEERFQVEHHLATDEVWYDLFAFSRPNYLVAKIGFPIVRKYQKAFARDSKTAMYRACND